MTPMLLSALVFFSTAHAGDKIGNGGGLWGCVSPDGQLQSALLVDFHEATSEFGWTLQSSTRSDPYQIVDDVGASIQRNFPDYWTRWSSILTTVKAITHFTDSKLERIDDSLYRLSPPPSLCRFGWSYVQFANFNDVLKEVLIYSPYWNSPVVSSLDKAGLIWHEVIYRWMREEFGDKDSVRARQIVGVLFSTMNASQARAKVDEILKQGSIDPTPTNPVFVCQIKNGVSMRWFLDYGPNELQAKNRTLATCQNADPNLKVHCDQFQERCDSFTSMKQAYTCAVTNGVSLQTFTETGRSPLEAEAKARRACTDAKPEWAVHCQEPICN